MVLTNVLLSLTSISTFTYLWTCAIGIVPANLPYAYAAELGLSMAQEFPPSDPVMLSMTLLGFVASIAIAYKVGVIATRVLRQHGVGDGSGDREAGASLEPAADDDLANDTTELSAPPARVANNAGAGATVGAPASACHSPKGSSRSGCGSLSSGSSLRSGLRLPSSEGRSRKFTTLREDDENLDDADL